MTGFDLHQGEIPSSCGGSTLELVLPVLGEERKAGGAGDGRQEGALKLGEHEDMQNEENVAGVQ